MPYLKHMPLQSIEHMGNRGDLAEKAICATAARVGRKLEYPEKREAAFAEGTLKRIAAVRATAEPLAAFIRTAVENEIKRRKRARDS